MATYKIRRNTDGTFTLWARQMSGKVLVDQVFQQAEDEEELILEVQACVEKFIKNRLPVKPGQVWVSKHEPGED